VVSYWGHENTLRAASAFVGVDLTPSTRRPALRLSANGYPELDGCEFRECWVLSPNYRPGFRPAPCVEPTLEDVEGWTPLHVSFNEGEQP
jgi:hypothetical protein